MYEDDNLEYDYDAAMKCIVDGKTMLGRLVSSSNNVIKELTDLQEIVHDKEGSNITEDYKDYAVLFGEEGMKKFVQTLEDAFQDAEDYLNEFNNYTHS
jgi:hypothetical protein